MLNKKQKSSLLLLALLALHLPAFSQTLGDQQGPKSTKENSPYSRFGIGNLSNSLNATIRGIGGSATAYSDPFSVNSFNPATYSFLKTTSLDFALEASSNNVFMNNKSYSSNTVSFSYLSIGIPLGKNLGMAFGLKPVSTMYYNTIDTTNLAGIGDAVFNNSGSGGLNSTFLGFSGKYKGFSIGANGGYTFGSFDYAQSFSILNSVDSSIFFRNGEFRQKNQVGGFYWSAGLLYQARIKKDNFLNIGATVNLAQQLSVKKNSFDLAYTYLNDEIISFDTTHKAAEVKGILQMPTEYSFGIFYGKGVQWSVGADFKYADWSKFNISGDRSGIADDAWRLSVGGEFTPDNSSSAQKKFLSLISYRLGAYYGQDQVILNSTQLTYMGATIGASFPLKRQYTQFGRIHTILDIGKRGTSENGLAREFFVKFTFGISLNDIWFQRPKYN